MRILSEVENRIHPTTRKALSEYVKKVVECEQDNLLKIVLFGSVAREQSTENSDVDVLVLLKESGLRHQQEIAGITVDVQWDMNFDNRADIMSVLKSEKNFQNSGFIKNINNEGILLYDSAVNRAYYAVFYCEKALLFTRGITGDSHGHVHSEF